jgi:hypothetical protein
MFKRILGIVLLIVGLLGLLISVGGTLVSRGVVAGLGSSVQTTLDLATESLDAVGDTLALTKTTVDQAGTSIDTLVETAANVSATMSDTLPVLDKVTDSATRQIPDSIEAVQDAIPAVAEAAGAIDDTLRVLNSFEVNRRVFGVDIQFDLGIDYQPDEPLDDTVLTLGSSLDGIPANLRALESDMVQTSQNVSLVGGNIDSIAGDLESISQTVDDINPLLDQYIDIVGQTKTLIAQAQKDLDGQLGMLQLAVTALFTWLGLNQFVPLYLGWTLLTGDDDDHDDDDDKQSRANKKKSRATGDDTDESDRGPDAKGDEEAEADESS